MNAMNPKQHQTLLICEGAQPLTIYVCVIKNLKYIKIGMITTHQIQMVCFSFEKCRFCFSFLCKIRLDFLGALSGSQKPGEEGTEISQTPFVSSPHNLSPTTVTVCVTDKAGGQCHLKATADIWLAPGVGHSSGFDEWIMIFLTICPCSEICCVLLFIFPSSLAWQTRTISLSSLFYLFQNATELNPTADGLFRFT